ncbi:hypothetical protein [Glycomyces arizonensis]|uniref:hypothetical protein n=1 Tax=Glycomyces arizonensis TaxID=256035 RepID=UPI00041F8B94|nr:hypothetical protein [Glycomyces arizonensis]
MSDYRDIVDGNGEIIHVAADDSADGQSLYQNGERIITADEDAFDVFAVKTSSALTDLDEARSVLTMGDLGLVAGLGLVNDLVFSRIDAQHLKVGTFPEAEALAIAYLEHFYKPGAEAVERVWHGIDTGKTVATDTMAAYVDADGNVAADVTALASEFDNSDGTLTETEFAEFQTHGPETEAPGGDESTGGEEESVRLL